MISHEKETGTADKVRPVPDGYHTVTPFIIVKGAARFLDFMKEAFNATETGRMTKEYGTISHAEARIGDAVVMTFDSREEWPETPGFLRLYVEDCDATYRQSLKAGASSVTEPTDMPWGDRVCRVRDPLNNIWWIMTHTEDVTPEEMEKRWKEKRYIDALQYVERADFFPTKPMH